MVTPNGLHFTISHAGNARSIRRSTASRSTAWSSGPSSSRRSPLALSARVALHLRRVRRQQRAAVLARADPGERAGAARPRLVREWTGVPLSVLLDEAGVDPEGEVAGRRRAPTRRTSRAASRSARRSTTRWSRSTRTASG
jgi:hypothetical protein